MIRLFASIALMVFYVLDAHAAEIHLSDGSVVHGEILSLIDGEDLEVDTAHMGDVLIEWDAIVTILNAEPVELERFDGSRSTGVIRIENEALTLVGEQAELVDKSDVYGLRQIKSGVADRLSAYTDFGSNFVRGNNRVSQLSLGAGVGYEGEDFEALVRSSTILNEQQGAPDTQRFTLNASYQHRLGDDWGALGSYQFESDEQQGLDGRSLLAAGLGKRLLNGRRHRLDVLGGLALNTESFEGTPEEQTGEGFFGATYRWRSAIDADIAYTLYPSLEGTDRVRAELNGSLSLDVISDLDLKITVYDRYDSKPPLGNQKNDSGVTIGLSWEY